MNAQQFVKEWKREKENILLLYKDSSSNSLVSSKINNMNLDTNQKEQLDDVLNDILNEVFYTFLLGLDGCANIGDGMQESFKVYDSSNKLVASEGELEGEAYEQFMT